jgi:catechol 2,3-dioxygenase
MAEPIDPGVDIGHVHLKVADIDRALGFYRDVLGFEVQQRMGDQAAFISAGGYHHHIGLNTWESKGASPPPRGTTGLYHVAIRYPTRAALGDALRRLVDAGIPLEGATDHGVSEAVYLRDPDDNGVELYVDRPKEDWPRASADEGVAMFNAPLDLQALLAEAKALAVRADEGAHSAAVSRCPRLTSDSPRRTRAGRRRYGDAAAARSSATFSALINRRSS